MCCCFRRGFAAGKASASPTSSRGGTPARGIVPGLDLGAPAAPAPAPAPAPATTYTRPPAPVAAVGIVPGLVPSFSPWMGTSTTRSAVTTTATDAAAAAAPTGKAQEDAFFARLIGLRGTCVAVQSRCARMAERKDVTNSMRADPERLPPAIENRSAALTALDHLEVCVSEMETLITAVERASPTAGIGVAYATATRDLTSELGRMERRADLIDARFTNLQRRLALF